MLKLIYVLMLVAIAAVQAKNFTGFKVYRVIPSNKEQALLLQKISKLPEEQYNFWTGPSDPNVPADVMIAPEKLNEFENLMNSSGTTYSIHINNVQDSIDYARYLPTNYGGGNAVFDWKSYHTLEEIYKYLDDVAAAHPNKANVIVGGRTYEGRQIKGIKLSFKRNNPAVFIEAGIHAREWIGPATATYLINELLNSRNPSVRALAESNDWYIFPSVNPDGFVYTHTHNRLWRKTRKPYNAWCYGSDPNRNWGYKWMKGGASSDPCLDTFAGSAPWSEIETQSLAQFITSISGNLYAYISFHSYSQLLLLPYGHTKKHLDNYDEAYQIGRQAITALSRRYGTHYDIGNVAEAIYIATGGSVDWVKATFKVPLAYTYELRDVGRHGFLLPPEQIIPTGQETVDSLVALFKAAGNRGIPRRG